MSESAWAFVPLKTYQPPAQPVPENTDWEAAARAFDDWLQSFGGAVPSAGFPQAVAGLFGRAEELLRAWAQMHHAHILEPPPVAALLDGTAQLWPELQDAPSLPLPLKGEGNNMVYVIPALERCFLRHWRGISFARQLVEAVWAKPCRLLIGCDAWAWKYLRQAVQIDALCPDALTAAELLALPASAEKPLELAPRDNDFRIQAYALHTLLMHDGVAAAALPHLLPFRATQVMGALADLRERQLAFEADGAWRVAPQHYAAIRKQLAAVEFWVSDV